MADKTLALDIATSSGAWGAVRPPKTATRGQGLAGSSNKSAERLAPAARAAVRSRGSRSRERADRDDRDAQERIAELEAELAAYKKTISVLLDEAERRGAGAGSPGGASDVRQWVTRREGGEKQSSQLARANSELRALTKNLDQIVRIRTRALAESEAQLREKNEELARLNDMKAEFISIAAHELRTPLTSIVGYHDLMLEGTFGQLPEAMKRPMESLRRNSHRLKRLVDEMLDVSRIESGRVVLRRVACDVGSLVADAVHEMAPMADKKRQHLAVEIGQAPTIHADPDKIHQVVTNLLSNAIRYTPEGGRISVIADVAPKDRFPGWWARLRVLDNGVGIPRHLWAQIFEPFSDVNSARYHTSSGPDSAGLGLYIARGLVDLHGGLISVDSREGQYSEFTILLPIDETSPR